MSQGQQPGEELLPEEPKASGKQGYCGVMLFTLNDIVVDISRAICG